MVLDFKKGGVGQMDNVREMHRWQERAMHIQATLLFSIYVATARISELFYFPLFTFYKSI